MYFGITVTNPVSRVLGNSLCLNLSNSLNINKETCIACQVPFVGQASPILVANTYFYITGDEHLYDPFAWACSSYP